MSIFDDTYDRYIAEHGGEWNEELGRQAEAEAWKAWDNQQAGLNAGQATRQQQKPEEPKIPDQENNEEDENDVSNFFKNIAKNIFGNYENEEDQSSDTSSQTNYAYSPNALSAMPGIAAITNVVSNAISNLPDIVSKIPKTPESTGEANTFKNYNRQSNIDSRPNNQKYEDAYNQTKSNFMLDQLQDLGLASDVDKTENATNTHDTVLNTYFSRDAGKQLHDKDNWEKNLEDITTLDGQKLNMDLIRSKYGNVSTTGQLLDAITNQAIDKMQLPFEQREEAIKSSIDYNNLPSLPNITPEMEKEFLDKTSQRLAGKDYVNLWNVGKKTGTRNLPDKLISMEKLGRQSDNSTNNRDYKIFSEMHRMNENNIGNQTWNQFKESIANAPKLSKLVTETPQKLSNLTRNNPELIKSLAHKMAWDTSIGVGENNLKKALADKLKDLYNNRLGVLSSPEGEKSLLDTKNFLNNFGASGANRTLGDIIQGFRNLKEEDEAKKAEEAVSKNENALATYLALSTPGLFNTLETSADNKNSNALNTSLKNLFGEANNIGIDNAYNNSIANQSAQVNYPQLFNTVHGNLLENENLSWDENLLKNAFSKIKKARK